MLDKLLAILNFDRATVICALLIVLVKIGHRNLKQSNPILSRGLIITDFLNGVMVVPFFSLFLAVFMPEMAGYMLKTNIVIMTICGGFGLVYILGELWRS
jgi:hypothetical protein